MNIFKMFRELFTFESFNRSSMRVYYQRSTFVLTLKTEDRRTEDPPLNGRRPDLLAISKNAPIRPDRKVKGRTNKRGLWGGV